MSDASATSTAVSAASSAAPRPRWFHDAAYAAILVLLFHEVFFAGARVISYDLLHLVEPLGRLLAGGLRGDGSLLWDAGTGHGLPLAARWYPAVFYPPQWLFAVLPADLALTAALLLHLPLAAAATMRLATRYTTSLPAAWLAGLAYGFGGYALSMVGAGIYLYGAALLPLSVLACHRLAERATLARALQLAVVLALQIFSGDAQTLLFELLIVCPLVFFVRVPAAHRRRALTLALASGGLAMALAWCQLWPALEMATLSARAGGLSYAEATSWSLHPLRLVELLAPGLFGGFYPEPSYWGGWLTNGPSARPWAESISVGGAALVGLLCLRRADRRAGWLWGAIALLFFLLALGRFTPLYRIVAALPGAGGFRYPEKHMVFVALALAMLAAIGLGHLFAALRQPPPARGATRRALVALLLLCALLAGARLWATLAPDRLEALILGGRPAGLAAPAARATLLALDRALAIALVLLATLTVGRRLRPRALAALLVTVATVDLLSAGLPVRQLAARGWSTEAPAVCDALPQPQSGPPPLIMRNGPTRWPGDPPSLAGPAAPAERERRWEHATGVPNSAIPYCARYGLGYDGATLQSRALLVRSLVHHPDHLADLLGLTHLIDGPGRLPAAYPLRAHLPAQRVAIHDNPDRLPYAFATGRMLRATSLAQAVARVADPRRDFRHELVLEGVAANADHGAAPRRSVVVRRHRPGRIELFADFAAPGFVGLLETHYPGWRAAIDDRPAPLHRANAAFLGLAVPRGRHRVALTFDPPRQRVGNVVSCAALGALIALGALAGWRARRQRKVLLSSSVPRP